MKRKTPKLELSANQINVSNTFARENLRKWDMRILFYFLPILLIVAAALLYRTYAIPSQKVFNVSSDTYVAESSRYANYQTSQYLLADAGSGSMETGYLQFALSGLSGKIVKSAQLKIRTAHNSSWNSSILYASYGLSVDYQKVSWSTRPSLANATKVGALGSTEREKTYYIPISFSSWRDGNLHLVLAGASSDGVNFYSNNSSYRPQLLLTVDDPQTSPTVSKPAISLSASPQSVAPGGSTTVSWTVRNSPSQCTAGGDGWSGIKQASGSEVHVLSSAKTFRLSCFNAAGTTEASIFVNVASTTPTTPPASGDFPINIKLALPSTSGWALQASGSAERFNVLNDRIECFAGGYAAGTHYARVRRMLSDQDKFHIKGEFWLNATFELPSNFYEQHQSYMRLLGTDNYPKATNRGGDTEVDEWRIGFLLYGSDKLPRLMTSHQGIRELELWRGGSRLSTGKHSVALRITPSTTNGSWDLYIDGVKVGGKTGIETVPNTVPAAEQVVSRFYGCIDGAAEQDSKQIQVNLYGLEIKAREKAY